MELRESLNLKELKKSISIFTIGKLKFSISLSYEYRQQIDLLLELLFHALIQTYIYYCITI